MITNSIQEVKTEAEAILRVWAANPDFKLKEVTLDHYKAELARFDALLAEIQQKADALRPVQDAADTLADQLAELAVRARSSVKGYFGKDSLEYELVGGTRASAYKRPGSRKPKTPVVAEKVAA